MKKMILTTIFVGVALVLANASVNRTNFTYAQTSAGIWTKIPLFDPARCLTESPNTCGYISTIDFGPSATQAQLIGVSAIPSSFKRIYFQ